MGGRSTIEASLEIRRKQIPLDHGDLVVNIGACRIENDNRMNLFSHCAEYVDAERQVSDATKRRIVGLMSYGKDHPGRELVDELLQLAPEDLFNDEAEREDAKLLTTCRRYHTMGPFGWVPEEKRGDKRPEAPADGEGRQLEIDSAMRFMFVILESQTGGKTEAIVVERTLRQGDHNQVLISRRPENAAQTKVNSVPELRLAVTRLDPLRSGDLVVLGNRFTKDEHDGLAAVVAERLDQQGFVAPMTSQSLDDHPWVEGDYGALAAHLCLGAIKTHKDRENTARIVLDVQPLPQISSTSDDAHTSNAAAGRSVRFKRFAQSEPHEIVPGCRDRAVSRVTDPWYKVVCERGGRSAVDAAQQRHRIWKAFRDDSCVARAKLRPSERLMQLKLSAEQPFPEDLETALFSETKAEAMTIEWWEKNFIPEEKLANLGDCK